MVGVVAAKAAAVAAAQEDAAKREVTLRSEIRGLKNSELKERARQEG